MGYFLKFEFSVFGICYNLLLILKRKSLIFFKMNKKILMKIIK